MRENSKHNVAYLNLTFALLIQIVLDNAENDIYNTKKAHLEVF